MLLEKFISAVIDLLALSSILTINDNFLYKNKNDLYTK